jgi:hypothetical protein
VTPRKLVQLPPQSEGGRRKQLMIQRIPDISKRRCTVQWDTGAQISLIKNQYAKDAGFKGHPCQIQISGVGSGSKKTTKIQCRALLRKMDGLVVDFATCNINKITGGAILQRLLISTILYTPCYK